MNAKRLATISALALALGLAVMILGGSKARAVAPICTVGPAGDYTTIQGAVNDPGCATINVAPGTYNEQVQINRTLTLNGAKAGVDARTRSTVGESIIDHACGPVQINADNVVLDGFTIQGSTDPDPCFLSGIWTNPGSSGTQGGHQILNNIVQNNISGIELDNTGTFQTKVQFNLIQNNNNPGPGSGNAIQVNFGLNNALIDNNKFSGHTNSSMLVTGGSQITFSNNELVGGTPESVVFFNVSNSSIMGNTSIGSTAYGTIQLAGGNNGISVTCNTLAAGQRGIRVADPFSAGFNHFITANQNNIQGNIIAGLQMDPGSYVLELDAKNNWWGSQSGPTIASNSGGNGDKIIHGGCNDVLFGCVVFYKPFLTSASNCAPALDLCPTDPNKTEPGVCGCGFADTDTDGDGTLDCNDLCPADPDKIEPGTCGCGFPDIPGCATTSVSMGPQAMEGDLKVHAGDLLKVGYDFTMPGSHAAAMVSFLNSTVTFQFTCVNGPGAGGFAVSMPNQTYPVPQNNSNWFPSGDQKSSLVFQGSRLVPNVCSGGLIRLQKGGTFTTLLGSDNKTSKVNIRWHYSANGSAGGWSGTQSVVPK